MSRIALVPPEGLRKRRDRSIERLEMVRSAASSLDLPDRYPSVVVYATGSVGRKEAGSHSDLDIFCVDVAEAGGGVGKLGAIRLFNDLIHVNEAGHFPEFSGDGRFLELHPIDDVLRFLGTRTDDYRNLFTARMLLVLESEPLFGREAYACAVTKIVDLYWRDCGDAATFKPTFLVNDLVRYWKTLCLAHETERFAPGHAGDDDKRKRRVAVLKLQFNRVWMVFNGLAYLLWSFEGEGVAPEKLSRLISLSPLERATAMAAGDAPVRDRLSAMLEHYSWFLDVTDKPKAEIADFFGDERNYGEGRERGRAFADDMAALIDELATRTPIKRYLLI